MYSMTTATEADCVADRLKELPPSAKLVYKTLVYDGPKLTQPELAAHSRLATRTVRHALGKLAEKDLVTKQPSPRDARQSLYSPSPD